MKHTNIHTCAMLSSLRAPYSIIHWGELSLPGMAGEGPAGPNCTRGLSGGLGPQGPHQPRQNMNLGGGRIFA